MDSHFLWASAKEGTTGTSSFSNVVPDTVAFPAVGAPFALAGKEDRCCNFSEGVGHCMCKKYCLVMYSMDIMWQEKLEPHTSDKKALELEHGPYLLVINMMIECYMCPKAGYWHWPALGRTEAMECQVDCCASSSHGEVT